MVEISGFLLRLAHWLDWYYYVRTKIRAFVSFLRSIYQRCWYSVRLIIFVVHTFITDLGSLLHTMCFPVRVYHLQELLSSFELKVYAALTVLCCFPPFFVIKDLHIYPEICAFNLLAQFAYFIYSRDAAKVFLLCALDFCCTSLILLPENGKLITFFFVEWWTLLHYTYAAPHPIWTAGRCYAIALLANYYRFCITPLFALLFLVAGLYYRFKFEPRIAFDFLLVFPAVWSLVIGIFGDFHPIKFFKESYIPFSLWLYVRHLVDAP